MCGLREGRSTHTLKMYADRITITGKKKSDTKSWSGEGKAVRRLVRVIDDRLGHKYLSSEGSRKLDQSDENGKSSLHGTGRLPGNITKNLGFFGKQDKIAVPK